MLEFFHERKEFFQLKELEKFLPKEKGIVVQTVKEVLQSLIDDHLVMSDKIGISNYFWSFPGTALINVSAADGVWLLISLLHRKKRNWNALPRNMKS